MFRCLLNRKKLFLLVVLIPCFSQAATFTVNDSGTAGDATPGDNICETTHGAGDCSLRAAIDEARALTGAHTINFDSTVSIIPFASYDLSGADISIEGPGRALLTLLINDFGTLQNDSISGITLIHGTGVTTLDNNASISDSTIYFSASSSSPLVKNATGSATIDSSELIGASSSSSMINILADGTLIVSNSTLRDHLISTVGGTIHANGTLTVSNTLFTGNSSGSGVVITATSSSPLLTVTDSTFASNIGAGIIDSGTSTVIIDSYFINNVVSVGVIQASGTASMNISGSVIANNYLSGGSFGATAIYFISESSTLTISSSSITGNISPDSRGTIFSVALRDNFTNVTISDNQMNGNSSNAHYIHDPFSLGLGLAGRRVSIFNSTISNNVNLGSGTAGVYLNVTSAVGLFIENSIIANNTNVNGVSDCAGLINILSLGYNIIGALNSCTITKSIGDQFGTITNPIDPELAALTIDTVTGLRYRAPLQSSPALDMGEVGSTCSVIDLLGIETAIPTDLLGNPRPIDGNNDGIVACDIGAIELQPDTTPDAFVFTDQIDVPVNTLITSDVISVGGIDAPVSISITNGKYRINTDNFTDVDGVVNEGDKIDIQHTSHIGNLIMTNTTLTIGEISDTFTSTTIADVEPLPVRDATPNAFIFTDQTEVAVDTLITSNTISVSGINVSVAITISNGKYRINTGDYTDAEGAVKNGDTVDVQHTSNPENLTNSETILTIGGISNTFTTTTIAAVNTDTITDKGTESDTTTGSSSSGGSLSVLTLLLALPLWIRRRWFI